MTARYVGEKGFNMKGDLSTRSPNLPVKTVQFDYSRVTSSNMGTIGESPAHVLSPNVFAKPSFCRRQNTKRRTSSSTSSSSLDHVDEPKEPQTPPLSPSSRKNRKMDALGNRLVK